MAPNQERRLLRLEWGAGLAISALCVSTHLVYLFHAGGLWRDEVNSVNMATMFSFIETWRHLSMENCPVFFPAVLRFWASLSRGSGDLGIRVFGFAVGLCLLCSTWWNARILGYRFPFVSMGLLCSNLVVLRWGDSMRAYGLGSFLMLMTAGMIWLVVEEAGAGRVILAAVAAVLSVQTLYQNAILLLAFCLAGCAVSLRRGRWKEIRILLSIGFVSACSLAPYAGIMSQAQEWWIVLKRPVDARWVWQVLSQALDSPLPGMRWVWVGLSLFGIGFAIAPQLSRSDATDRRKDLTLFSAVAMVVGVSGFYAFLRAANLPIHSWYYLPLMAPVALCLDVVTGAYGEVLSIRGARVAFGVGMAVSCFPFILKGALARQTNVDLIASSLEKTSSDDLVLLYPWYCGVSFSRYYKGAAPWTTLPPLEDYRIHRYDLFKKKIMETDPIGPVLERIAKTLKSGHKVWLVGTAFLPSPNRRPPDIPPAPHGPFGWNDYAYLELWDAQAGYLLRTHALYGELLPPASDGPVSEYEDLRVQSVQGWRTR